MKLNGSIIRVMCNVVLWMGLNSCQSYPLTDLTQNTIIPKPVSVVATGGAFVLSESGTLFVSSDSGALWSRGEELAAVLKSFTGGEWQLKQGRSSFFDGAIFLVLEDQQDDLGNEGYELTIDEHQVRIRASHPAGIAYGIQTFCQLLPPEFMPNTHPQWPCLLPAGTIHDFPLYPYRGAMLDVARHFFSVEEVKQYIDYLAMYKMNVLHLHLSDDQGWRVEIKSWPNLTKHGGSSEVGGGKGGFYTQAQYREIVDYAQHRFVTIVPEIDMPGHTNAALASYPELTCDGKSPGLYTGTRVGFSSLCTNKKIVYQFVDDVVREISEMTPGPYFHIGGDESHSTPLKDYKLFVNKVQKIVASHGKRVIGWDEIAHASLEDEVVVQYWAKDKNAIRGVSQGAKVIMSPAGRAYLDMKYNSSTVLGLHWAGYIEVDHGYDWDPASLVPAISQEQILGVEAPLWSETVSNIKEIEYLLFPRILGYAEIGWTPASSRSWDEYKVRLGAQSDRLKALGINYYPSPLVPWTSNDGEKKDNRMNEE